MTNGFGCPSSVIGKARGSSSKPRTQGFKKKGRARIGILGFAGAQPAEAKSVLR